MTEPSQIFQQGDLIIVAKRTVEHEAIKLLEKTVYGTSGVRYQQTGQAVKLHELSKPFFFYLYKQKRLIGMYCLDERVINLQTESVVHGFYGRYLSVDVEMGGKGYGHLLKEVAITHINQNYTQLTAPSVFYSYIEEKNTRSLTISKKGGFDSVAVLRTYFFRRYSPRKDTRFKQLHPTELTDMVARLMLYYEQYTMRSLTHIGYQENYFVLQENGQVVAGVQANPVRWKFTDMPGITGWLMMNVVPLLKGARRFFNPAQFDFVALEGLYLTENREDLLPVLLESVLAHFGLTTAMWQIDENDPHIPALTKPVMGLGSGFKKGVRTHVMVKGMGLHMNDIKSKPACYVSSFDYT